MLYAIGQLQPAAGGAAHPIVPSLLLSLLAFYLGNVVGESAGRRHHYPLEENCYALIQLKLNTTGSRAEDLSDALVESGAVSVTFQTPRQPGVRTLAG